eukprot:m51a1_g3667 hypothetical protein (157) ;mRNA; r:256684-264260
MAYYAGPAYGAPAYGMPVAMAPAFPAGYPVYTQVLAPNMYYKPIWTPKREAKLQRLYWEVIRDGVITFNEILYILQKFGFTTITPYEAQWFFFTLDRNRDGRVDYVELRMAMQEFVMRYPRTRNPYKMYSKPHYTMGYDWTTSAMFPQTSGRQLVL